MAAETIDNDLVLEMAKVGLFYGHNKTKTNPRMKPYIGGRRNEIELLDPEVVLSSLEKAGQFLKEKLAPGGLVLFVGTKPAAKDSVKAFAEELKMPYVVFRWLGGTLTNFKVLNQRSNYYQDLKSKIEKGELAKYTKKEQLDFAKESAKMSRSFDSLKNLNRLPDAVFAVDPEESKTAVAEARKMNIPVIAIMDTNDDPAPIGYPIFANDHTKSSVDWIFARIKEAIKV
ncbi:MAG: 30S ribosomal protein S2 [Minisyncoccia bacterium]|jgi:small subunit ribosomal protein S2